MASILVKAEATETRTLLNVHDLTAAFEDDTITATSESIISVTVTDAITERQTELISATIAAAFTVLAVFFWVTVRRPALALIAVGPIVLVLISVLGTMALLNIPYTIITSIITALSIGIGVLLASPLAALQQFGFTAAITIAYSLIVSILLVPPAMTIWGAYQNMRLRSMVQNWGELSSMKQLTLFIGARSSDRVRLRNGRLGGHTQ